MAQNFTSDPKYGGQYNYGEVQYAIWRILGFTDQVIYDAGDARRVAEQHGRLRPRRGRLPQRPPPR